MPTTSAARRPPLFLSVKVSRLAPGLVADAEGLPAAIAQIEAWGADQITLGEHVVTGRTMEHPGGREMPAERSLTIESLTLLAAAAAVTTTVRLSAGALIAPLRTPIVLAKTAASLDVISGGRLDLGVVAGWYEPELVAAGVADDERFARLDECLRVCRLLWAGGPVRFDGRWTTLHDVEMHPRPPQGTIPIWIGGRPTAATARRVAELGDGWIASESASVGDVAHGIGLVRHAAAASGRDPGDLAFRAALPPRTAVAEPATPVEDVLTADRAAAKRLRDVGVTHVTLPLADHARSWEEAEILVRGLSGPIPSRGGATPLGRGPGVALQPLGRKPPMRHAGDVVGGS